DPAAEILPQHLLGRLIVPAPRHETNADSTVAALHDLRLDDAVDPLEDVVEAPDERARLGLDEIVLPAEDLGDGRERPAPRAPCLAGPREVAGPIADERHCFVHEPGRDDLADRAGGVVPHRLELADAVLRDHVVGALLALLDGDDAFGRAVVVVDAGAERV